MKRVKKYLKTNNRLNRLLMALVGNFIACIAYYAFTVPHHIVSGGVSGLAVLVNSLFGTKITLFITVTNGVLILLSLILLGFKKTSYSLIGFVIYDLMLIITEPIAKYFVVNFDSFLMTTFFWAAIAGVGYGLVYRTGLNTGGSDVLVSILQNYFVFPYEVISNIISFVIIGFGAKTFGIVSSIYALVYVKVTNAITNKVQIGESNAKICYIESNQKSAIQEYLHKEKSVSYTLLSSTNGVGILPRTIIFTVIPSDEFDNIRKRVLKIDKHSRLIATNCYTVLGGKTNKLLPVEI